MAQKWMTVGVRRERGWLYWITYRRGAGGRQGYAIFGKHGRNGDAELIRSCSFDADQDYLYFLDKDGDISRAKRRGS